jgi:hypothetical protein
MTGGHQIIIPYEGRKRSVPEWVHDAAKIRELLIRAFPKMMTDARQRERAGRWARLIYLYFQANFSDSQVANEMGLTVGQVKKLLNSIRRVAAGKRANNGGKRGIRPRGRPRVIGVSMGTSLGGTEEGSPLQAA